MKILKLIHPEHGLCSQEVIRRNFPISKVKNTWAKKYGQIIKNCTYELCDDNPYVELSIRNTQTGDIYENKKEAMVATGITLQTLNNILTRKKYYPHPYYLTYIENKAI